MTKRNPSRSSYTLSEQDIVAEFMSRYRKEYDFYEQACRMAAQLLDTHLQSAGVRAIVTSRAKNPTRLEAKARQRAEAKNYTSVDQIYEDIVDLAGIRVALYFPGEREATGKIIASLFSMVESPKEFPDITKPQPASYNKRFSGYWATHYRVRIQDEHLNDSQKRYLEAKFEIQLASVLMHAWSEVEHDLVYKPLQGQLSEEEYSILDELNGMVLAGEIALERLQRAGETRVATNHFYTNHYDLATSLLEFARKQSDLSYLPESLIGRVDLLFKLLQRLELNTTENVLTYVKALHDDLERRPIAEQIIDQVLAEDPGRFEILNSLRAQDGTIPPSETSSEALNGAIGKYLRSFSDLENLLKPLVNELPTDGETTDFLLANGKIVKILPSFVEAVKRARRFRSRLVHGKTVPDLPIIMEHQSELQSTLDTLEELLNQ